MAVGSLVTRREGSVVIATLNRPDKMNALNKDLFEELKSMLDVLETDKTARLLIVTGGGDKAFSGGADLKERQGMSDKDILVRADYVNKLYARLERLAFPVIAAIGGVALGAGLELALACDLRVASSTALFGFPEVELGIIPGNGGTQRLPRIVGIARALELVLLAKKISAQEAHAMGLIHHVVPPGQALSEALTLGNKILDAGPIAIRQAKYAIRMGMDRTLEQGLQVEFEAYRPCLVSKDRHEGVKAFVEKRKPAYKGE
jgi:enoyl-CoA hydratase/carnithine racemase